MIADTGLAALWLAAALALVHLASGKRPVATAQAVMAAIAAVAMIREAPGFRLILAATLLALALFAMYRRSRWSRRSPMANIGISLARMGAALIVVGAASDQLFPVQIVAVAKPGDRLKVGPWLVQFVTVNPVAGPNFTAIEADLRASRGSGVSLLHPQARSMIAPPKDVSEPAVETFWNGRLSATLTAAPNDGRQLRLQWQPFVTWIWLGGALIALGGLIVLVGKMLRQRRRRERRE